MKRPTLADVQAGAERAYQRWRRWSQWKRELGSDVPSPHDLLAERDGLKADISSFSAQLNEAYDVLRTDRGEAQVQFNKLEQQLRAARELRDEACGERDSLVIERDRLKAKFDSVDVWASKAVGTAVEGLKPMNEAPKDGTWVLCVIPASWNDSRQAFMDRANVWVTDDEAKVEVVSYLPAP